MIERIISKEFDSFATDIVYLGDCVDFLSTIPNNSIQLIVTSPPYNIGKRYENKSSLEDYLLFQNKVINECFRVLNDNGSICWQVGNYVENGKIIPLDILLFPIFQSLNLQLRNRIVWHFGHGLHSKKRLSGRYEVILWFTKSENYVFNLDPIRMPQKYPGKKHFKGPKKGQLSCNPLGKNPSDVWEIPNVKSNHVEKTIHPCQFPIELVERLVLSLSNKDDWVFDPFMGVGSMLVASVIHNRKSMGSELVKEYYDIALKRIRSASNGTLKRRPMNKPIYEPSCNSAISDEKCSSGVLF